MMEQVRMPIEDDADAAAYACIVTETVNGVASVGTSAAAVLTVNLTPTFTTSPVATLNAAVGSAARVLRRRRRGEVGPDGMRQYEPYNTIQYNIILCNVMRRRRDKAVGLLGLSCA